ncbi:glycosyltransferase family 2 protein [Kineosporia sp. R_H_3]|uniref:glycosyltransferase family 2 protein n=1 Tax=Kineosporia sp. R_H_3 TaxID=1961848 RepID=UPI000B4B4AB2|nr:glycosyltransferase family 2 protein [Kineosporia sp. R_H_3]
MPVETDTKGVALPVALSAVVPCYNEEGNLERLLEALSAALTQVQPDHEIVLVDDGSRDATLRLMREAAERDPRVRYVALSRNFGKESAMLAGLSRARGRAVAILDADLQHPPELLSRMIPLLAQGFDQVVARRTRTGDAAVRSVLSRLYYRVVNRLVDVELENGVGDFRLLSRTAVDGLLSLGESNRFSKGLFAWIGYDVAVVDYENVARTAGESHWRLRDLVNYAIDSVLSFNTKPLRLAIHVGLATTAVAVLYGFWVLAAALLNGNPVPGYVTTIAAVVGLGGIQMMLLGVTGEYLGRIYVETKQRPHFLVKETNCPGRPDRVAVRPAIDLRSGPGDRVTGSLVVDLDAGRRREQVAAPGDRRA